MLKGTFGDTKKESNVWIKKSCELDQNRGKKISIDFSFKAELANRYSCAKNQHKKLSEKLINLGCQNYHSNLSLSKVTTVFTDAEIK